MNSAFGFAVIFFLGTLAVSVKSAIVFGMDYILSSPPTIRLMAVWAAVLTVNGCAFKVFLTRRHSELTARTVAWILPALHMASCHLLMFGTFFILRWVLGEDAWSRATGLPTPFAIRVAGLLYLVTNLVIMIGLAALLAYYFKHRNREGFFHDSDEVSTRRRVRIILTGLILAIAVLTSVLVVCFPENIHFYMAALSSRTRGKGVDAREFFVAFLKKYPASRLSDSAKMMAAKVMIGSFSDYEGAEALLLQVEARQGPLADEAMFTLGRLYAFEMGMPDKGETVLRRFIGDFPGNPLVDEAMVILSDLIAAKGRVEEALKLLDAALQAGDGVFFIMDTDWLFRGTEPVAAAVAARRTRILHPGDGVL